MTRRFLLLATALFAMAMFALATTSVASAQVIDNCCVRIENNTACHVTVCVGTSNTDKRCTTLYAYENGGFTFPCNPDAVFWIADDACGHDHRLVLNQCVRVHLRGGCCAQACLRKANDGCYYVTITQLHVDCPCPEE